jgi:hypothetical protein
VSDIKRQAILDLRWAAVTIEGTKLKQKQFKDLDKQTRHYKLARKQIRKVAKEARKRGYEVRWGYLPYQLIIGDHYFVYSVFCGGFIPAFNVQRLTPKGKPDFRYTERGYLRVDHLLNHIDAKWEEFVHKHLGVE